MLWSRNKVRAKKLIKRQGTETRKRTYEIWTGIIRQVINALYKKSPSDSLIFNYDSVHNKHLFNIPHNYDTGPASTTPKLMSGEPKGGFVFVFYTTAGWWYIFVPFCSSLLQCRICLCGPQDHVHAWWSLNIMGILYFIRYHYLMGFFQLVSPISLHIFHSENVPFQNC